jgi:hypothetical protein
MLSKTTFSLNGNVLQITCCPQNYRMLVKVHAPRLASLTARLARKPALLLKIVGNQSMAERIRHYGPNVVYTGSTPVALTAKPQGEALLYTFVDNPGCNRLFRIFIRVHTNEVDYYVKQRRLECTE